MKWPFVASSLFSTNISSQQFIGQSGFAFFGGIAVGTFQMMGALCFGLLAVFFINTYRNLKIYTSPEFYERRYNKAARKSISAINIVMIMLATVSVALYAGSIVILTLLGKPVIGTPLYLTIIILGIITGAYTMMGGLKAVIYTDFIQNLLLILGGLITLIVGIRVAGGLSQVAGMQTAAGESMWLLFHPFNHKFGWLPVGTGVLILGIHGHCTDQDYVQRTLAAKNAYHAKMGAVVAGFMKVLALFICAMPGVIAAKVLQGYAGIKPDQAYVALMVNTLPKGILGLCLAGLIAAIMSSVDSGLCAASSLISFDFIKSNKNVVTRGRIITGVLIVLAMAWAPVITKFNYVFKYLMRLWAYFAPPVVVCVLFGLFYKKATSKAAITTLITGVALGAVSFFALKYPDRQHDLAYFQNEFNIGFIITLICAALMILVSKFGGRTKEDIAKSEAVAKAHAFRDKQDALTPKERTKYIIALVILSILFVGMFLFFSPLGAGSAG